MSTERAIFRFPSLGWQTCVSPPEMTLCARGHSTNFLVSVSGQDGPEAGSVSLTRAGPARTRVFDPQDTGGLSLSEGIIIISGDVSAFDTTEKTDKVTTNVASGGASSIGCNRCEADLAVSAR